MKARKRLVEWQDNFPEIPNAAGGGIAITGRALIDGGKTRAARRFQRCYYVYILANLGGTLYVGLTDDMRNRMIQHKAGDFDGFTKKYKVDRLMYFATYTQPKVAANRELQIKKFRCEKKIALFVDSNPGWKDLTPEIFQSIGIPRYARDFRKNAAAGEESLFYPGELDSL